ncbi:MAG: hypothetical protein U5R06_04795 [candidate division KSB1 bacterium]|nr:hypothetical protein [candidate division KSB1 bacterium]
MNSRKILILSLFGFQAFGQSKPPTNLELYALLYESIFASFVTDMPDSSSRVSLIALDAANQENWIAEEQWIKNFQAKGASVYTADSAAIKNAVSLYYRPVVQKVEYTRAGNTINRTVRVECYLKCTDPDNRVLFSRSIRESTSDRIKNKQLPLIENPLIASTRAKKPVSRWQRLVEPLIISIVSGSIITIFYSYRSK